MPQPILELRGVDKHFGDFAAVERVDLSIAEGEFFTIVGPSGSGKTTLIRMLVGMDAPTRGEILLRGGRLNETPANKRPFCMVFQSLALFPHMSVGENVAYSLKCRGMGKAERRTRAVECLELAHLPESYYDRAVAKCSGGEKQRVALARALAFDPEILFFDEPLSALDYRLRKTLEKELKDIQRETGKTFIYITHSLEEAMVMSDRIGVMRDGRMVQVGAPRDVYDNPRTRFVSEFFGEVNAFDVVAKDGRLWCDSLGMAFDPPPGAPPGFAKGALIVRPEHLHFDAAAPNPIRGEIYNEYLLGSRVQYQVHAGAKTLLVEGMGEAPHPADRQVALSFAPEDSRLFAE